MQWKSPTNEQVPELIFDRIKSLLAAKSSLTWFVSGGSNIQIETTIIRRLKNANVDLTKLTILLIDERFGEVGHDNSNWAQLENTGFMIDGPRYVAPFTHNETTLELAVKRYEIIVHDVFLGDSYIIAQLGMGDDGHVAGILPNSSAGNVQTKLVYGYDQALHRRLTTTFPALQQLDEVILVAYGKNKSPQLATLSDDVSVQQQPAQILKDISAVTIYTDYKTD